MPKPGLQGRHEFALQLRCDAIHLAPGLDQEDAVSGGARAHLHHPDVFVGNCKQGNSRKAKARQLQSKTIAVAATKHPVNSNRLTQWPSIDP